MSHESRRPTILPPSRRPSSRTYVVLALADATGVLGLARPLGTIEAPARGVARAIAAALFGDVPAGCLRVLAAAAAPADLVARALALDGAPLAAS